MSEEQGTEQEVAPAKRGKAYFDDVAAKVAKKNADAQKAARASDEEEERRDVLALRDAERRDIEAAIRSHERRGKS